MSSEAKHGVAIQIEGLSKSYQIYEKPRDRLKQIVLPTLRKMVGLSPLEYHRTFWALRDINLEIFRGETFGIVGKNGAGKSTLLQLISGVLNPTGGRLQTNGRITALLELGAGLNPEFTGIENIRVSAAVLGMSESEFDRKLDVILKFADLGDFIDQPVKYYSSGMIMRLAFSVAINFDPDILVVDEALAVGDELFQLKCFRRIQQIKESGATILFVSHSTHTVNQVCDRAALIDGGRLVRVGPAKQVSESYNTLLFSLGTLTQQHEDATADCPASQADASVTDSTVNERMRLRDLSGEDRPQGQILDAGVEGRDFRNLSFKRGDVVRFRMRVKFNAPTPHVIMGMMITTVTGVDCYHTNLLCRDMIIEQAEAGELHVVSFELPLTLNAGSYCVVFDCQYDLRSTPKLVDIFYEALNFSIAPDRFVDDGGIAALAAKIDCQIIRH